MIELKEFAHYVTDKIKVSNLNLEEYISTENMVANRGGIVCCESMPEASAVTRYSQGDILVSNIRPYFKKIWYAKGIGGCSNDILVFRANHENINSKFLYYALSQDAFFKHMMAGANGTKMPRGNKTAILSFRIPNVSVEKQKIIAEILSSYDNLIENNQRQITLLEEAAQRLYKEWFVDLRFPGHETTPITDGIPEGWKRDEVNSIIGLLSGFAFKSAAFTDVGTYKIVTIKNVQDGMFDGHNVSKIAEVPSKMPAHCYLNDGDILLSLTGNVGRVCMVNGSDYLLNQRVAKLKSEYPAFAYCLFRSNDMFVEMGNLANGAAQQNLSPIKTGQIKILIPPVDLLNRFENVVSVYMKQILNLNKQIGMLQETRDRLLPKLMNGEIEV